MEEMRMNIVKKKQLYQDIPLPLNSPFNLQFLVKYALLHEWILLSPSYYQLISIKRKTQNNVICNELSLILTKQNDVVMNVNENVRKV